MGFPRGWTRLVEEPAELPNPRGRWVSGSDADAYAKFCGGSSRCPTGQRQVRETSENSVVVQVPMYRRMYPTVRISGCDRNARLGCRDHGRRPGRELLGVEDIPGPQDSDICRQLSGGTTPSASRVRGRSTRELNAALEVAGTVVRTMEEIVPYLARMQALRLSQRRRQGG